MHTWLKTETALQVNAGLPPVASERITRIFRKFQEAWREGVAILEIPDFSALKLVIGHNCITIKIGDGVSDEMHIDGENEAENAGRMFSFAVGFLKANRVYIEGVLESDIFEGLVS